MTNRGVSADQVCNTVFAALPREAQDTVVQCVVIEPGAEKEHPHGLIQFEFEEDAPLAFVRKIPLEQDGIPIERFRGEGRIK